MMKLLRKLKWPMRKLSRFKRSVIQKLKMLKWWPIKKQWRPNLGVIQKLVRH